MATLAAPVTTLPPVRLGDGGPIVGYVTNVDRDTGEITMDLHDERARAVVRASRPNLDALSIGIDPPTTLAAVLPGLPDTAMLRPGRLPDVQPIPDELRRVADAIESRECTGVAARWCPVHGTCACPDRVLDGDWHGVGLNDPACPLHASTSSHAEGLTDG